MKEHFVITVGREYGSGGRAIAKLVAQKLNVPFYDKELLTLAAQKSGICQEIFEHNDEKTTVSDMLPVTAGTGFGAGVGLGLQMPMNQRVFLAQFEVITNLAKEQSCVIVGRCADYVLKEMDNVARIFVYAPFESCVQTVMDMYTMERRAAEKVVTSTDKHRSAYYKYYTGQDWDNAKNYDLSLNSEQLGFEKCVKIIKGYLKVRFD